MIILSTEQVLMMYHKIMKETGGIEGIRDVGSLESALQSPFQTFHGIEVFPSIEQKAARLGFGIISNHPFLDGNKRIGAHVMLVFLFLNGIELVYSQENLVAKIFSIASGKEEYQDLLQWILDNKVSTL
ncbi:MAG: type II toxin-antitoxin system death-on-curing family toxin [Tissierellia bacterium]|nr:type II toxin-antitoxin system death-on-curing family toxin [Tissierellia bacterium]